MDIWLDVPSPVEAVLPRRLLLAHRRTLIVGRGDSADITVSNNAVAKHHCELGRDGCGAWVRDLTSRNGTFVNGRKGQIGAGLTYRLLPNDVVGMAVGCSANDTWICVGWNLEVDPFWLRFEAGAVLSLARKVRDEGDADAMRILGDALEDVGCTDADILAHLRGPGPHVRECWIIDAILNGGRTATQEPRTK